MAQTFSTTSLTAMGSSSTPRWPASILEKSRMSSITLSREKAESRIRSTMATCGLLRLERASTSIMPITPFIGVRISWLMAARKLDLACAAALASLRASSSSALRWRSRTLAWARSAYMRLFSSSNTIRTNDDASSP